MKPKEAMRALPIEGEEVYVQLDKRMCQLFFFRRTSIVGILDCSKVTTSGNERVIN